MENFTSETKKWLQSVIKQRKFLMRKNVSHVNQAIAMAAIDRLDTQLSCYPYTNEVYMAKFIIQYSGDILAILPGKGSACFEKKHREFDEIKKRALCIDGRFSTAVTRCGNKQKTEQYEMAF
jgi:hypothetical protein